MTAGDRAVGSAALGGAIWTVGLTLASKAIALGGQIAVAWFITPEELGVAAAAIAYSGLLSSLVSAVYLRRILIQKQNPTPEESADVLWLGLATNLAVAAALGASAGFAADAYSQPLIETHLLVLCLALPLNALPTVHAAALSRALRFRVVSLIHLGEVTLRSAGAVLLAALGFGTLALTIPIVLASAFAALCYWYFGRGVLIGRPRPSRFRPLIGQALWLAMAAFGAGLQTHGPNFIVSLSGNAELAGLYAWSFLLATQSVFLFSSSLQDILFPSLARIQLDEQRMGRAFQNAATALVLIMVPVCVIQALLTEPIVDLIFQARWQAATPAVQWLTLGMMTHPLNMIAGAVRMARGEYRVTALRGITVSMVVLLGTLVGSRLGGLAELAACSAAGWFLGNLIWAVLTVASLGARWVRHALSSAAALATAAPMLAAGWGTLALLPGLPPLLAHTLAGLAALLAHAVTSYLFWPQAVRDIFARLRALVPARSPPS